MTMKRFQRFAIGAIVLVCALPIAISAQISSGTKLTGTIDNEFNSKTARVNQTFTLSNVHSTNHDINGATVYGHIAEVQAAGQGTSGKIQLDIDKINTRSGNIYKTVGAVTDVQVDTKSNAGKEIASVAGGALVGGLLGKGWGAAIGGGSAFLLSKNSRQNITIPKGSLVTVQIAQATRIR
jgi:hypothetical protein